MSLQVHYGKELFQNDREMIQLFCYLTVLGYDENRLHIVIITYLFNKLKVKSI